MSVNEDVRSLTMPGPFHATVADPNASGSAGKLTGAAGDKLILTLADGKLTTTNCKATTRPRRWI